MFHPVFDWETAGTTINFISKDATVAKFRNEMSMKHT